MNYLRGGDEKENQAHHRHNINKTVKLLVAQSESVPVYRRDVYTTMMVVASWSGDGAGWGAKAESTAREAQINLSQATNKMSGLIGSTFMIE